MAESAAVGRPWYDSPAKIYILRSRITEIYQRYVPHQHEMIPIIVYIAAVLGIFFLLGSFRLYLLPTTTISHTGMSTYGVIRTLPINETSDLVIRIGNLRVYGHRGLFISLVTMLSLLCLFGIVYTLVSWRKLVASDMTRTWRGHAGSYLSENNTGAKVLWWSLGNEEFETAALRRMTTMGPLIDPSNRISKGPLLESSTTLRNPPLFGSSARPSRVFNTPPTLRECLSTIPENSEVSDTSSVYDRPSMTATINEAETLAGRLATIAETYEMSDTSSVYDRESTIPTLNESGTLAGRLSTIPSNDEMSDTSSVYDRQSTMPTTDLNREPVYSIESERVSSGRIPSYYLKVLDVDGETVTDPSDWARPHRRLTPGENPFQSTFAQAEEEFSDQGFHAVDMQDGDAGQQGGANHTAENGFAEQRGSARLAGSKEKWETVYCPGWKA